MPAIPRRTVLSVLAGSTAWLLGGCASSALPIIGRKDPDDDLRLATATSELDLIDAYRRVAGEFRAVAAQLNLIREQHERHLAALVAGLDEQPPAGTAAPPDLRNRGSALRSLRRMESGAARQRAQACVDARGAEVVEMLARIGASEASHVAALRDLSPGAGT